MAVLINNMIIYTCRYSYLDFDGFGDDPFTKEAFEVTIDAFDRINGWYLLKNFKEKNPMHFFNSSIGKYV